ncbi:MAG: NEW3 domain-containing protein [Pseudolabrys sp.]
MTFRLLFVLLGAVLAAPNLIATSFAAETNNPDVKGIYLLTDYPAVTVQPGTTSTLNLKLRDYDVAPERLALSVSGVPQGWTATLLGGGQPIAAAMPATDDSVSLDLRLDVPKDAQIGTHTLTISAEGANAHLSLPVAVTLAKDLPAKLALQPQLPELRGSAHSTFEYTLTVKNDSGKKLLVSLAADAPQNFDTSFTEAYGSQQLTAIPIDAGKSKDVKLKVSPPDTVDAGHYPVKVRVAAEDARASADVALDITGQPKLTLAGREGLLSAHATAGKEASVPVEVTNTGTAPAENVTLSGNAPNGWKVTFEPKTIARIAPNEHKEVQALISPPGKAIAGDYVTTLTAAARGETGTANFRVTVTTSTVWGVAGIGIIGVALLIMVGAVARFGRR